MLNQPGNHAPKDLVIPQRKPVKPVPSDLLSRHDDAMYQKELRQIEREYRDYE